MKNNYISVLCACVCVCMLSCSNNTAMHDLTEIVINPLDVKESYDIANDVETEWNMIPLETNLDCLINHIDNLVYKNGTYYILDKTAATIFLFDDEGKFLSKLDEKGSGPGEYLGIDAFTVIGKNIWISDVNKRYLIEYNENMQFVSEFNLTDQIAPRHLINIGNYIYMGTNWSGWLDSNMQLASFDIKNKELTGLIYVPSLDDEVALMRKSSQLASLDDTPLFIYGYCDTVFQIKNNEVNPEYKMVFTSNYEDVPLPFEKHIDPKLANIIRGLEDIKQTSNSILLGYGINNQLNSYLFNKHAKTGSTYTCLINSKLGDFKMFQVEIYFEENNYMFCIKEPSYILGEEVEENAFQDFNKIERADDKVRIQKVRGEISEDSNPVIIRFKLKTDSKL